MSLASYHCSTPGSVSLSGCFSLAAAVSLEGAGRRELSELVPHHVLCHVQLDKHPAVVDGKRRTHKVGDDGTVARPGLDRVARAAAPGPLDLGKQPFVHVGTTFLNLARPTHV